MTAPKAPTNADILAAIADVRKAVDDIAAVADAIAARVTALESANETTHDGLEQIGKLQVAQNQMAAQMKKQADDAEASLRNLMSSGMMGSLVKMMGGGLFGGKKAQQQMMQALETQVADVPSVERPNDGN